MLAEELRNSSIFVLTSLAEGVPKVSQEAAACGLPIVLYGFYDAPTVVHERNGLVAWSDREMDEHVARLIGDPELRQRMGLQGAEMAGAWDWDLVAPRWEELGSAWPLPSKARVSYAPAGNFSERQKPDCKTASARKAEPLTDYSGASLGPPYFNAAR